MLARRSTIAGALAAALAGWSGGGGGGGSAHADWEIRRSSAGRAEQALRALAARPDDDRLALRLFRSLGPGEAATLLDRAERNAASRTRDGSARLVYAQFLLAARRWPEAAAQFEVASSLAPGAVSPHWGRARALGGAGNQRAAIAELRTALALARGALETARVARELTALSVAASDVDAEIDGRRAWARARPGEQAVLELAAALGRAGQHAEAAKITVAEATRPGRPGRERARWALSASKNLAAAGDLLGAAATLKDARQALAANGPTGRADLRRDLWSQSIEVARRGGSLAELRAELADPADSIEWLARARIADEQGNLRDSWSAFDEAIRRSPRDVDLRLLRLAVAKRVGSAGEVARLYEDLADVVLKGMGGDGGAVISEILDGLWQLGRPEAATRAFDRMLSTARGNGSRLRILAEAATRWGDDRRAEQAWTALLRWNPRDEMAIIALGEARFQRGQRRPAIDTWRGLLRGRAPAEGHARFAEVLADHDLRDPALAEARTAIGLAPRQARHHRLMARILEREFRMRDAEAEWEAALRLARGPARSSERREARGRLVGLWVREGAARIETKLRELERSHRQDESDREALAFLVELLLRTGRTEAAIDVMSAALSQAGGGARSWPAAGAGRHPSAGGGDADSNAELADADVDLLLLLIHTLRQVHRPDEAMSWLEELSRRHPSRARDVRLQLADIALAEHADQRAEAFAEEAAAADPGDPRVVLRAAAVQERLGRFDQALQMYRRLVEPNREPTAVLALSSLLTRLGKVDQQRELLRQVLRAGLDQDLVAEAGRRVIVLEEAEGTLEALEAFLADAPDLNAASGPGLARRRVLATVLARVVPAAYRGQHHDAISSMRMRRFARHGLRPLLDLIGSPDAEPDPQAIEILGMLGRPEAVPELARLVVPDVDPENRNPAISSGSSSKDELAAVIVIALGRIGGDGARAAIEAVAEQSRSALRLPVLWALGRVGGQLAVRMARQEIGRAPVDGAVVGCLTLGRVSGREEAALLEVVAGDATRVISVRVGAVLGLALGDNRSSVPALTRLADAGDPDLSRAARLARAWLARGPRGNQVPDEAPAITGGHIDPDLLLRVLLADAAAVVGSTATTRVENAPDSPHSAP